jgi:hypothetical protein
MATPANPTIRPSGATHNQGRYILGPTVRADTKHFMIRHSPTSDLAAGNCSTATVAHVGGEVNPPHTELLPDNGQCRRR